MAPSHKFMSAQVLYPNNYELVHDRQNLPLLYSEQALKKKITGEC